MIEDFLAPIYRYVCETPNRVPIADIYLADSGRRRANQARSVVGGFFMKLLADQFAAFLKNELAKWGRIVKESGAKID